MRIIAPNRVTRTFTQHLAAEPAAVFELLCPVREADWLERWDPTSVISESGVAETGCVFVTPADSGEAIWIVTRHEPDAGFVEMLKITPGVTVCEIAIQLTPAPQGTDAVVTYSHTSLGSAGDEFVDSFTERYYVEFMCDWESRLNHYLETGEMLRTQGDGG